MLCAPALPKPPSRTPYQKVPRRVLSFPWSIIGSIVAGVSWGIRPDRLYAGDARSGPPPPPPACHLKALGQKLGPLRLEFL
jgi:hypothetical protein